jgi:hypothetical protein
VIRSRSQREDGAWVFNGRGVAEIEVGETGYRSASRERRGKLLLALVVVSVKSKRVISRFGLGGGEVDLSHGFGRGASETGGRAERGCGRRCAGLVGTRGAYAVGGKEAVTGDGETADDEHADQPDHDGHEDGNDFGEGGAADDRARRRAGVVDDGHRDAPPGEAGVEARREQPRAEEVPNLGRFVAALFGGEDAGDAGEVDAAKGHRQDGGPAHAREGQAAEHIQQGKLGGAEVEYLEGQQGADDHHTPGRAAVELASPVETAPECANSITSFVL